MQYCRSYLFVPPTDAAAVESAQDGATDAIVLDLEDALRPTAKPDGRDATVAALEARPSDAKPHVVRVNGLDTRWGVEDLEALLTAAQPPDAVLLPEVRSASDVAVVEDAIDECGCRGETGIIPLVERPEALFRVHAIASASPLVVALAFGKGDFQRHLGTLTRSDADISVPRYRVSMAASAVGVPAVDTPYLQRDDPDGLRADNRDALRMGYDAKLTFLPAQIPTIHESFTPTPDAVERSRFLVRSYEETADEEAAIYVDDTFLDKPVVDAHRELLTRARELGVEPDD